MMFYDSLVFKAQTDGQQSIVFDPVKTLEAILDKPHEEKTAFVHQGVPRSYIRFAGSEVTEEAKEKEPASPSQKKDPKATDYHVYNRKNTPTPLATYHTLVKSKAREMHRCNAEVLEKQIRATGEYPYTHWLQNKKKNKIGQIPYVVFDTETTGVKKADRVIQLAFSHVREDHVVTHLGDHNVLIHPGFLENGNMFPIQPGAQAIHGITPLDLKDAPQMHEILRPILKEQIGENALLVGYNAKFDVGMINEAIHRLNRVRKGAPPLRPMDAALVLDPFVLLQRIHPFNALNRKLTNHYEILMGTPLENAHDAQADVDATVDVLKYCLSYLEKHQIPLKWAKFAESNLPRNRKMRPIVKAAHIAEVVRNNRALFEAMMPLSDEEKESLEVADVLRFQHGSSVYHENQQSGLPKLDISLSIFGWDGTKAWDGTDELDRDLVKAIRKERDRENRDYLRHKFGDDIPSTHLVDGVTTLRKAIQPIKRKNSVDIERALFKGLRKAVGDFLTEEFLMHRIPTAESLPAERKAFKKQLHDAMKAYFNQVIEEKGKKGEQGSTYRLYHKLLARMTTQVDQHVKQVMAEIGHRYFYTEKPLAEDEKLIESGIFTQLEVEARKPRRRAKTMVSQSAKRQGKMIVSPSGQPIEKGLIFNEKSLASILDGQKRWEVRRGPTRYRGTVALIQRGTGKVYGTAELVDCVGPLTQEEMMTTHAEKHQIPQEVLHEKGLPYGEKTCAWVLDNVVKLKKPLPYDHPSGATRWVNLPTKP